MRRQIVVLGLIATGFIFCLGCGPQDARLEIVISKIGEFQGKQVCSAAKIANVTNPEGQPPVVMLCAADNGKCLELSVRNPKLVEQFKRASGDIMWVTYEVRKDAENVADKLKEWKAKREKEEADATKLRAALGKKRSDLSRRRYKLERYWKLLNPDKYASSPVKPGSLLFRLSPSGEVTDVVPGGPAQVAGLTESDKITRMEDVSRNKVWINRQKVQEWVEKHGTRNRIPRREWYIGAMHSGEPGGMVKLIVVHKDLSRLPDAWSGPEVKVSFRRVTDKELSDLKEAVKSRLDEVVVAEEEVAAETESSNKGPRSLGELLGPTVVDGIALSIENR